MEGPPRMPKKQESLAGKFARAVGLAAALHAESAVASTWPGTVDAPTAEHHETAPLQLAVEDLLKVTSNYRADLAEVFSRATTEQKEVIKNALTDTTTAMNDYVHGEGDPDILRMQAVVRDLEKSGEMRPSPEGGAVLPFDDPEKYAAFEAAREAESKTPLKPEEMQKITVENATPAQIENWVRSIKVPPRLWPK